VPRRLIAPPTVRLATAADAAAIRAFRCGHRPWYVQDAVKVIRRAASLLGTPIAKNHRMEALLFEANERLVALTVVQQTHDPHTADLVVLAVHSDFQGTWLDEQSPRPLCVAVLEEATRHTAREGYKRIVTMVAAQHAKSIRLITGAGYLVITEIDRDYRLYGATCP
jgi:GNAT superfamily N-acetyltransferase